MINYSNVRILIYIIFLIIIFICLKKGFIEINRKIFILIYFLVPLLILFTLPVEKYFLKFDTIEKAFEYSYPGRTEIEIIEFKDYAFLIYNNNDSESVTHFIKKNQKWIFTNPNNSYTKLGHYGKYIIIVNEIKEKDVYFIEISCFDDIERKITDSLGTEFEVNIEDTQISDYYTYRAIVEITDNYYINIEGVKKKLPNFIPGELKDY